LGIVEGKGERNLENGARKDSYHILQMQLKTPLEQLQYLLFPHFADGDRDEATARDSLKEKADSWHHGMSPSSCQAQLESILLTLKGLADAGLGAASVLANLHHR
jgi:hypothetical protein